MENRARSSHDGATRIIPIRRPLAPSAGEVRAELLGRFEPEPTRYAVAVLFGVWELGRGGAVRWDPSDLGPLTGLGPTEVEVGKDVLLGSGVLRHPDDDGAVVEIRPDLLWELPSLADFRADAVRARLGVGRSLAAALSLGWELALRTSEARRAVGVETTLESLAADTLYSRSSLKRALQELETAGLLERAAVPRGIRLRLLAPAWADSAAGQDAAPHRLAPSPTAEGHTVVRVPGGGAVTLSGGSLDVGPGLRCVASLGPDGTVELELRPE